MLSRSMPPRLNGFIEPCLPSPALKPPAGPGWIHEIKHDGFRLLARQDAAGRSGALAALVKMSRAYWSQSSGRRVRSLRRDAPRWNLAAVGDHGRGTVHRRSGQRRLVFSVEVDWWHSPIQPPLASHWRVQARLCFSIRPSVQTRMAVRQVGVRKIFADASKFVSCARFMGMRTLGRLESEEIAARGCFERGSKRPTPPRNRSGGSPSRPAARADAR
jgi:hypothetical protein